MAQNQFVFKKRDNIGAPDAEGDQKYLFDCFVDDGSLDVILDCSNNERIIVGRTGCGKTALMMQIKETQERVVEFNPESLALDYISNSTVLNYFEGLGVNLDIFYKLLWKHVITVELLKMNYKIDDEVSKRKFFLFITNDNKDKKRQRTLSYLDEWGSSFWEETEYRIREITEKLEGNLRSNLNAQMLTVNGEIDVSKKLSKEQTKDVVYKAQSVVNRVQVKQLTDIINMLSEVFNDPQKKYYITIDRLDEDWVEEKLKYRLIKGLIEVVREFRKVKNVKIVISLRVDLIDRVYAHTKKTGFQEEKYEGLYLPLEWEKEHLIEVLDNRINHLVKSRYTKRRVTYSDILPGKIDKQDTIDYIVDRTLMRPRDIIRFFNVCIQSAKERPALTVQMIREAEGEYSRARLQALYDEWRSVYPNLSSFVPFLKERKSHFILKEISSKECEDFCWDAYNVEALEQDTLRTISEQLVNMATKVDVFKKKLFQIFYDVGLVRLKPEKYTRFTEITS